MGAHIFLHLADSELTEMEDACRQHGIGFAFDDALSKVLKFAHAAGSNNGDVHCTGNCSRERQVKAVLATIAIHASKEDLACAATCRLGSPLDSIKARVLATAT